MEKIPLHGKKEKKEKYVWILKCFLVVLGRHNFPPWWIPWCNIIVTEFQAIIVVPAWCQILVQLGVEKKEATWLANPLDPTRLIKCSNLDVNIKFWPKLRPDNISRHLRLALRYAIKVSPLPVVRVNPKLDIQIVGCFIMENISTR